MMTGPDIVGVPLPNSRGVAAMARSKPTIVRTSQTLLRESYAIHVRLPCFVGGVFLSQIPEDRPYGAEVVGDPNDVFGPGAFQHPLRPAIQLHAMHSLRRQVRGAAGVSYVTEHALQRRYPASLAAYATHYSSVSLQDDAYTSGARTIDPHNQRASLLLVGTLERLYKAPDVLIDAIAICVARGLDLQLSIVGDGKHRSELEERAQLRGIQERVRFAGQLPAGESVRAELDRADLFVLPSRTEGLPRAMIEAMARGLPCIGSTVGGIPELLPAENLVPPGDAQALADKISEVLGDPARMAQMSARNLEKAREYHEDVLRACRIAFYQYVRERTEEWIRDRSR